MHALNWTQQQINFYTDPEKLSESIKSKSPITYVMLTYLYRLAYSSEHEFTAALPGENQLEIQQRLCNAAKMSGVFSWKYLGTSNQITVLKAIQNACEQKNQAQALALIQSGMPVSREDLSKAINNNCVEVVQAIIEQRPDWLDAQVFLWACGAGCLKLVELGLKAKVERGNICLWAAMQGGHRQIIQELIKPPEGLSLNTADYQQAVQSGFFDLVIDLVSPKPGPSIRISFTEVLKTALMNRQLMIAQFLFQNNIKLSDDDLESILKQDLEKIASKSISCDQNFHELLLNHIQGWNSEELPILCVKAATHDPRVIKTLKFLLRGLEYTDDFLNIVNGSILNKLHDDLSPLMYCLNKSDAGPQMIKIGFLLLQKEAVDLWKENGQKKTALHYAAASESTEILKHILDKIPAKSKKQYLNKQSLEGTALHCALRNKRLNTAQLLIKEGADVSLISPDGYTALMGAVVNDDVILAKHILTNPTVTNPQVLLDSKVDGKNALQMACSLGCNKEMVLTLIRHGYDTAPKLSSALPLAITSGSLDLALTLAEHLEQQLNREQIATIFQNAVRKNKGSVVKQMLESSAFEVQEDCKNIFETVPEFEPNDSIITRVLLENGADPSLQTSVLLPHAPFFRGINKTIPEELFQLMIHNIPIEKRKSFLNTFYASEGSVITPLTQAIRMNRLDLVGLLMEGGAELTFDGIASALCDPKMMTLLLEKTPPETKQRLLKEQNSSGQTLIQMAAQNNQRKAEAEKAENADVIDLLISAQADCLLRILPKDSTQTICYQIPINRECLAQHSPYLKALFYSSLKESSQKTIDIQEEYPEILQQLLRFLYTGQLSIHHNNFLQMLQLVDKYEIYPASNLLKKWLKNHPECELSLNAEPLTHTQGKGVKRSLPDAVLLVAKKAKTEEKSQ